MLISRKNLVWVLFLYKNLIYRTVNISSRKNLQYVNFGVFPLLEIFLKHIVFTILKAHRRSSSFSVIEEIVN